MLEAFWISLGVVFAAELGDKSQLMALAFAARYRALPVLAGITAATALVHGLSVVLGAGVASRIDAAAVSLVAGLAFFAFAAWTVRGDVLSVADEEKARRGGRSAFWAAGVAFFVAELGDKTMLATITLAARYEVVGTWAGSTVGMVAADALAIVVGRQLGARLPERTIKIGAAIAFFVFAGILLVEAL